jgi:hypothetical protein
MPASVTSIRLRGGSAAPPRPLRLAMLARENALSPAAPCASMFSVSA